MEKIQKLPQTRPSNVKSVKRIISRRVTLKLFSFLQFVDSWLPNPWLNRRHRRRCWCSISFLWALFTKPITEQILVLIKEPKFKLNSKEQIKSWFLQLNLVLSLCLFRVFESASHLVFVGLFRVAVRRRKQRGFFDGR